MSLSVVQCDISPMSTDDSYRFCNTFDAIVDVSAGDTLICLSSKKINYQVHSHMLKKGFEDYIFNDSYTIFGSTTDLLTTSAGGDKISMRYKDHSLFFQKNDLCFIDNIRYSLKMFCDCMPDRDNKRRLEVLFDEIIGAFSPNIKPFLMQINNERLSKRQVDTVHGSTAFPIFITTFDNE